MSNEATRAKCEEHRTDVQAAIAAVVGGPVVVQLVIEHGPRDHDDGGHDHRGHDHSGHDHHGGGNRAAQAGGPEASPAPIEEEAIDLDDLVDAPPEAVVSPLDRLQQAFPGSQLVEE